MSEEIDFIDLEKKIKKYKYFNWIIWFINLSLFLGQIVFYRSTKLTMDFVFLFFFILNIVSIYFTYKLNDRLSFFKYRFNYYTNLNNNENE